MNQPVQTTIIVSPQKSMGMALALTFFFGPLGLLYASVAGGIIVFILTIIIGIITFGLGFIVGWVVSMIWAAIAVNRHNAKVLNSLNPPVSTP